VIVAEMMTWAMLLPMVERISTMVLTKSRAANGTSSAKSFRTVVRNLDLVHCQDCEKVIDECEDGCGSGKGLMTGAVSSFLSSSSLLPFFLSPPPSQARGPLSSISWQGDRKISVRGGFDVSFGNASGEGGIGV